MTPSAPSSQPQNGAVIYASESNFVSLNCPPGTSPVENACVDCERGTYAANTGQDECIPCPHPLSSARGSSICAICLEGFYLKNSKTSAEDVFKSPSEHCKACPLNADCSSPNTTLESLGVDSGFWRASTATSRLYTCDDSDTCIGLTPASDTPCEAEPLPPPSANEDSIAAAADAAAAAVAAAAVEQNRGGSFVRSFDYFCVGSNFRSVLKAPNAELARTGQRCRTQYRSVPCPCAGRRLSEEGQAQQPPQPPPQPQHPPPLPPHCLGRGRALERTSGKDRGPYCAEGHTGPLCQVCSENGKYFSLADRHCVDCPGEWRLAVIAVAVALGAGSVAAAVGLLRSKWEPTHKCLSGLLRTGRAAAELAKRAGLWTKLKVAISFYQCLTAIPSVYVLTVPETLVGGAIDDLLWGLSAPFRFIDLAVPSECYGTMLQKLLGAAFIPYAFFLLLAVEQAIQIGVAAHLQGRSHENRPVALAASGLRAALPAGLFLSFLLLPSISSLIFRSFLCDAFMYDDATGATVSYLQADYSMECGKPSHQRLERWAYGLIPLWPAGVPALYLAFLLACRRTIRAGRVTHESASFGLTTGVRYIFGRCWRCFAS